MLVVEDVVSMLTSKPTAQDDEDCGGAYQSPRRGGRSDPNRTKLVSAVQGVYSEHQAEFDAKYEGI